MILGPTGLKSDHGVYPASDGTQVVGAEPVPIWHPTRNVERN